MSDLNIVIFLLPFLLLPACMQSQGVSVFNCTGFGFVLADNQALCLGTCTGGMVTWSCSECLQGSSCLSVVTQYCAANPSENLAYTCYDASCHYLGGYMQLPDINSESWQCANTSCPGNVELNGQNGGVGWLCYNQSCQTTVFRHSPGFGEITDWSCDEGACSDGLAWNSEDNLWACNNSQLIANYDSQITALKKEISDQSVPINSNTLEIILFCIVGFLFILTLGLGVSLYRTKKAASQLPFREGLTAHRNNI